MRGREGIPSRRRSAGALVAAVLAPLLSAGCAAVPIAGSTEWSFPPRYEANQLVSVDLGDSRHDLVASVRRDGGDVEVTLFDPALAVPLLAARLHDGEAEETRWVEVVPAGQGERLVRLLADLHAAPYRVAPDGEGERTAGGVRFRVGGFTGEPPCRFPRRVEVIPRGPGPRIRVETLDVACGGEPPAR